MQQNLQYIPDEDHSKLLEFFKEVVTFESFFMFAFIYAIIIWITMILWVGMDVSRRSSNWFFKMMVILLATLLGPLGLLLYLMMRPNSAVSKKFLGEIEHNLALLSHIVESSKKGLLFCPKCSKQISHVSKICPKCKTNLQKKCEECEKILLPGWKVCPFCSHKVSKKKHKKKA